MRNFLASLAMLIQACSASGHSEASGKAHSETSIANPNEQREKDQAKDSEFTRAKMADGNTCAKALSFAEKVSEGTLSAFRVFNDYPPVANAKSPGEVVIEPFPDQITALSACLPKNAFEFKVLTDGVLVNGTESQLFPLSVWRIQENYYLVTYLHKNYDMSDGEGEAVEVSGIVLDANGKPIKPMQELSSWYEYEGSIRIRDLHYLNGKFTTTEEVFDPVERDEAGRALDYVNDHGNDVIKEHYLH
ncbi:hypothetical protein ACW7GZ_03960 [Luteimonas sp. A537]